MSSIRKTFFAIFFILVILVLALGVLSFTTVRRSFPQTEGSIQLPTLDVAVEVFRDSYGIPHIYASTPHDLFMAQGFIHAQDRFWQMEFWRRVGAGRLSEILGKSGLENDRFIRTIGWHRTAAQDLEQLDPETLEVLEAYAEGVNAFLALNQGRLGLEFTMLGLTGVKFDPEPWTPLNSLTWAKVMAWQLGGNMEMELTRAHIAARLGSSAVDTLLMSNPEDYPYIVPSTLNSATFQAVPQTAYNLDLLGSGEGIGSNSWVISGSRTVTGMPLLANDPHLDIQMPSIWYEVGLHCEPVEADCPFNVVGSSFAGVPGVIIGHNDRIAWGVTNLGPDVQDLFIERVNPENPNQYEFKGEWLDMEIVREEIHIAGEEDPVIVNARITQHGPIINDVVGGTEGEWALGWQPLALSWTAFQPTTLLTSVRLLNQAHNWYEFREALSYWDIPSQNFIYADIEGNIGYQAPGRIPIRASGNGSAPVPGWNGEYEWIDFIPFDELPFAFNPEEGYIVTANNAVVGPDFPHFISMDWDPGYRARRIIELIEADDSLSVTDMQVIQSDSSPIYAQDMLPYILNFNPADPRLVEAINLLKAWDGRAVRDSSGAALFESLQLHLIEQVFIDELGEQLVDRAHADLLVALVNILPDPTSIWFDDVKTTEIESVEDIMLKALEAAVEELTQSLGKNISGWRWGDLHTATFENQSLGQSGIGLIEAIFNRGPVAVDGAIATVNNTAYRKGDSYSVSTVPSYRQIVDMEDLNRSLSIHTTGQSGHPYHPHYKDMIELWRNFGYHPMLWERESVIAAAEAHLTLTPGG